MNRLLFSALLVVLIYRPGTLLIAQERFVEIDGAKIWVKMMGVKERKPSAPLIVFESGHGTPLGHWDTVLDRVAELGPILAYDRPGVGKSEEDGELPTTQNVAQKLVKLLDVLELPPPYILVGHSLGGLYVRGFANHFPDKLAGLVIIDPADFTESLDDRPAYYEGLGLSDHQVDSLINHFVQRRVNRSKDAPTGIREESEVLESMRANNFQSLDLSPMPNIPVHLLIGGRFDMPERFRSKAYDDELLFRNKERHRLGRYLEFVRSVDGGMLFYSSDAGHFVHRDDPGLLVSSIRVLLERSGGE